MPHTKKRAAFSSRAALVREIAQGIYDQHERKVLLKFVSDAVKLVEIAPPRVILTALGASKPTR